MDPEILKDILSNEGFARRVEAELDMLGYPREHILRVAARHHPPPRRPRPMSDGVAKKALNILVSSRNAEHSRAGYIAYDRAIDELIQHPDIQAERAAALDEVALLSQEMMSDTCRKCGGELKPSKAHVSTMRGGAKDFESDPGPVTFSAGGPGKLIDCRKCEDCGWSVTQ